MALAKRVVEKVRLTAKLARLKLRYLMNRGPFETDYGWIKLSFTNDGDMQETLYHLYCDTWHENDRSMFGDYIHDGDVVVDVGANQGFVAAILAELCGESGHVFAFEPSPSTYRKLLRTIEVNKLGNVTPINAGVGSRRERLTLSSIGQSSGNRSIVAESSPGASTESVLVVPLDEVEELRGRKIGFLKIDTEGFESEVLRGASNLLRNSLPVICIELGGAFLESSLESVKMLEDLGYTSNVPADIDWETVGSGSNFLFFPPQVVDR